MVDSFSYTQLIFDSEEKYSIGFNDGRQFNRMKYVGTKLLNGKSMLCFETEDKLDLTVNPSYVSFYAKEAYTNNQQ